MVLNIRTLTGLLLLASLAACGPAPIRKTNCWTADPATVSTKGSMGPHSMQQDGGNDTGCR